MGKKGIALYGVGVNDSKTALSSLHNGLTAYDRWSQMLRRCYGDPGEYPTYSGCVVCDDWLLLVIIIRGSLRIISLGSR